MGGLNAKKQQQIVRSVFCFPINEITSLADKGVLLIDDVIITGATLKSSAWLLQKTGRASSVSPLVLSRVIRV